jgi:methylmalonyl-CoA/ethylmalonyl-CoA epimerase
MLDLPEAGTDEAVRGTSIIYYKVHDIDAAWNQFTASGATGESAPHKIADMPDHALWMAFIKDSEGNTIGLMEERR